MANALTRFLFDPVDAPADRVPPRHRFTGGQLSWIAPLAVGVVGVVIFLVLLLGDPSRALFSYLVAWTFCVSIALGSLFFVMIQHITKARWSTTIRRIPEALSANFPLLALAGIPVLLGSHDLFHWTHAELYDPASPYYDALIAGKKAYLNMPFFLVRYVLYFVAWTWLGHRLYAISVGNDTDPDADRTLELRKVSAYGIPLAAVTTAFAGFDFLMSTDPHWFSTMFGIYFWAGGWLGALCLITFLALWFKKMGMLPEVTVEHLQDMGKFMFAFVVFWTYIAFSQYMLYWYANIPEETVWFLKRLSFGWGTVAWSLVIFNFILPFLILLPRITKRIAPVLAVMAVWLLVMHWVDLWWVAMPAMEAEYEEVAATPPAMDEGGAVQLLPAQAVSGVNDLDGVLDPDAADAATPARGETPDDVMDLDVIPPAIPIFEMLVWLGLFGLFLGVTILRLQRHALTPYNDPYFAESLRFENV
ncbi:hypothetical protein RQM47_04690 [Rubrivirga sp. S365]|uniref:Quinol:cytochrome c oxidoreductase quinone-binding subunit 2 n=1 Tax=Rubrivirga litoralis TaxID=3075598 RepID=A0ABU3BPX7_9BACT|nr:MULTISPECIES: hypothetical protein [unclassified Rubrivirga]MDT0631339.1 hypothetical protein [Rubrivirga sp. F394]MDT7855930.1 hypothetical protein [Rubrivirga sp. S365]